MILWYIFDNKHKHKRFSGNRFGLKFRQSYNICDGTYPQASVFGRYFQGEMDYTKNIIDNYFWKKKLQTDVKIILVTLL